MDPFSSLSVAAAAIQFFDFGFRLVSESYQIYKSAEGRTENTALLESAATSLDALSANISSALSSRGVNSANDAALYEVARSCHSTADQILDTIKDLDLDFEGNRVVHSMDVRPVDVALKTGRRREKLAKSEDKLKKHRDDLLIHLMTVLRVRQTRTGILERRDISETAEGPLKSVATCLDSMVSSGGRVAAEQDVIRGLYYVAIPERQESIVDAYAKTFGWIFKGDLDTENRDYQANFHEWLKSQTGLFWISGKPGSGKSCLMKFIRAHPETKKCLLSWANGLPCIILSHFFWPSGNRLQKSEERLLRSPLFDIFRRSLKIIEAVCPNRLALATQGRNETNMWSLSELRATIWKVVDMQGYWCEFLYLH
ncbi:hypothetical protein F4677DRAFT_460426 [Hypoxylon crocopeplum]|nr:hypothetical protein F4677DRAFT_460426 [Hypoxylon crocopeplum]